MGDIELNTPDSLEYTFFPNNTGYFKFKVRVSNNAHIALSTTSVICNPLYEVLIGGWHNQRSVIRKNRTMPDKAEAQTPNILHSEELRSFWIRWDNKTIACGYADNAQPFVSWRDSEMVPICFVGVCTGGGATGSWIIHSNFTEAAFGQQSLQKYLQTSAACKQSENQPVAYNTSACEFDRAHAWIPCGNGNIPPNAFIGGKDIGGEPLYVVRCNFKCGLIPGKLPPRHENAYVCWGGFEHAVARYEVLCNFHGNWVSCERGNIPPNALLAGQNEAGEPLYVGRAKHCGTLTVGKVQRSHSCCYIPFSGQELNFQQYEILTE